MACVRCYEKKRSQEGKIDSGYLDRPDVIAKRNLSSKINVVKYISTPSDECLYDAHNHRLKVRRKEGPRVL